MCFERIIRRLLMYLRGHSSAGRASGLHPEGLRFDPAWLHQFSLKTYVDLKKGKWMTIVTIFLILQPHLPDLTPYLD